MISLRNGIGVEMTAEEVTAREAEIASIAETIAAETTAQEAVDAQVATDKASAVSKLEALGLTSSEIDTLKR